MTANEIPQAAADRRHGVVGVAVREGRVLVVRRSADVVAPLAWCFPGGHVEAGESEAEALIREFQEELHVAVTPVARIFTSTTAWGVELSWWRVELAAEQLPRANPREIGAFAWRTPAEIAALPELLPSNREFLGRVESGEVRL